MNEIITIPETTTENPQQIDINSLVTIDTPLQITEKLSILGEFVKAQVKGVETLEVNDKTVKYAKTLKADLKKSFTAAEDWRKGFKKECLAPYAAVENAYKINIADVYNQADLMLNVAISDIDNAAKELKREKIENYYNEYAKGQGIDSNIFPFSECSVYGKVNNSTSEKKLKEMVNEYLNGISGVITALENNPDKAEILAEFKQNGNNLKNAIDVVNERKKLKEQVTFATQNYSDYQAELNNHNAVEFVENDFNEFVPQQIAENFDEEIPENEIEVITETVEEKTYTMKFSAEGTLEQFKQLKEFMINLGVKFDTIKEKTNE